MRVLPMRPRGLLGALTVVASTACLFPSAHVSTPKTLPPLPHPVTTIALAPSGGLPAEAIGYELSSQGFVVVDTKQTSDLMVRFDMSEAELMHTMTAGRTATFADEGVDAVLFVRTTVGGQDSRPETIGVRCVSTRDGSLLGSVSWDNGVAPEEGSWEHMFFGRGQRKGTQEAAAAVGRALAKQLRRK